MYCYTLALGKEPSRGIHIQMDGRTPVPGVYIGNDKEGVTLPVSQKWFELMTELDHQVLDLPEMRGRSFGLPTVLNADIEEIEEGDDIMLQLVSRSGKEIDQRVLVHVIPPEGARVTYSGNYKVESLKDRRVVRAYPRLDDVPGIEVLTQCGSELVLVMQPNAVFRAVLPKEFQNRYLSYRAAATGTKARLIDLHPRASSPSEAA